MGDLGNVEADEDGTIDVDIVDEVISLYAEDEAAIMGRYEKRNSNLSQLSTIFLYLTYKTKGDHCVFAGPLSSMLVKTILALVATMAALRRAMLVAGSPVGSSNQRLWRRKQAPDLWMRMVISHCQWKILQT